MSRSLALATKVRARTTSRVFTAKRRFGSYTPAASRTCYNHLVSNVDTRMDGAQGAKRGRGKQTSAAMGTVELTGMRRRQAFGQALAACLTILATMLAGKQLTREQMLESIYRLRFHKSKE